MRKRKQALEDESVIVSHRRIKSIMNLHTFLALRCKDMETTILSGTKRSVDDRDDHEGDAVSVKKLKVDDGGEVGETNNVEKGESQQEEESAVVVTTVPSLRAEKTLPPEEEDLPNVILDGFSVHRNTITNYSSAMFQEFCNMKRRNAKRR
jgi:hypothetical protein